MQIIKIVSLKLSTVFSGGDNCRMRCDHQSIVRSFQKASQWPRTKHLLTVMYAISLSCKEKCVIQSHLSVESQMNYHREMLLQLGAGEEVTTSASIVYTTTITTGIIITPGEVLPPLTTNGAYSFSPILEPSATTTTTIPTTTLPPSMSTKLQHTIYTKLMSFVDWRVLLWLYKTTNLL